MMRMWTRGVRIDRPAVIAHRGASRQCRENTIAAFVRARALGADWVELDVRRSADGQAVVHHDAHLGAGQAICDLEAAEIDPEVPTLAAALAACAGMGVNIEIKNSPGEVDHDPTQRLAGAVAATVAGTEAGQPILVSSFEPAALAALRAAEGALPTALLTFLPTAAGEVIAACIAGGHRAWHPFSPTVDAEAVAEAHRAGLAVNVWTVDDADRMRELIAMGVDGLCTNVPDVARAIVDGAG